MRKMKKVIYLIGVVLLQNLAINDQKVVAQDNTGSGNCLSFDGVNDFVQLPNSASLDITGNTVTVEAWVRPLPHTNYITIVSKGYAPDASEAQYSLRIARDGDPTVGAFFWVGTSSGTQFVGNPNNYTNSEWMHLAGVYDGTTVRLYINGVLDASTAHTGNLTAREAPRIGRLSNDAHPQTEYFVGNIDEVRIWNTARTQTEIRDNMSQTLTGSETGLVGYWNANEGIGTTLTDGTSNNNDGTLQ